jgi:metacaspase-1
MYLSLLSYCDGDTNGLFTEKLLSVWNGGNFSGSYAQFHEEIVNAMPNPSFDIEGQRPNYLFVGTPNQDFENQLPFTIDQSEVQRPVTSDEAWPSVEAPLSVSRSALPTFLVKPGPNRAYALETATDAALFTAADKRNANNFYATWSDTNFLKSSNYTLPQGAWNRLKANNKLYYRILSNDNDDHWNNWVASDSSNPPASFVISP